MAARTRVNKISLNNISGREELLSVLGQFDCTVPSRLSRKTEQRENWTVKAFLDLWSDHIVFPLSLEPSERPDFFLTIGENRFGLEITEATSPAYAEFMAIHEETKSTAIIDLDDFRYGKKRLDKAATARLLLRTRLTGDGSAYDEAEQEWAYFVRDTIIKKNDRYAAMRHDTGEPWWLIVYDNTPASPRDYKRACELLRQLAEDIDIRFREIFVFGDNRLFSLKQNALHTR